MGKVILVPGADFSANGIQEDFIIQKNYAYTSAAAQNVNVCQLSNIEKYDFTNLKIEVIAKLEGLTAGSSRPTPIWGSQYDYMYLAVDKDGLAHFKCESTNLAEKTIQLHKDITFVLDTYNKTASIDGVSSSFEYTFSGGKSRTILRLFSLGTTSSDDAAGRVKIKSVKIWEPSTNTLLCEIKPVESNSGDGLYDIPSETLLETNSGELDVD